MTLKNHPDLTAERLREVLAYDASSGQFVWKVRPAQRIKAGAVAGTKNNQGYWAIRVDGNKHGAHRLAWLYVYGHWPADQIDHRNGVRDDNRICNLREATLSENQQNRKPNSNNASGHAGVYWYKRGRKWQASICIDGDLIHLGYFDQKADAVEARAKAKSNLHQFQPVARSSEAA